MKILLITSKEEDYLQDSIIHGFKQLYGKEAIEYPVKNMLYDDFKDIRSIRGNGFTLYGLLESNLKSTEIINIEKDILENKFNLIIFTSIYRQYDLFYKLYKVLKKSKAGIALIDGEDSGALFPNLPRYFKKFIFHPKPYTYFLYFKRELFAENEKQVYAKITAYYSKRFFLKGQIKTISFSIPKEKIINFLPQKKQLFMRHIVDIEVASKSEESETGYIFKDESQYYEDIQNSKFSITTKRAGWDCLRHYEIAANGSVICFKNLTDKPEYCAPHGLKPDFNCLSYNSYDDLMNKINAITPDQYNKLLYNSFQWINQHTTTRAVKNIMSNFNNKSEYFIK